MIVHQVSKLLSSLGLKASDDTHTQKKLNMALITLIRVVNLQISHQRAISLSHAKGELVIFRGSGEPGQNPAFCAQ